MVDSICFSSLLRLNLRGRGVVFSIIPAFFPTGNTKRQRKDKKRPPGRCEPPQIVQTVQKRAPVQEYSVLAGMAQRQRRHSCFALDALVV
ncbi:MAG TPA: hypothetical protein H9896_00710, partial [Candidatus Pygmaiobacter gallistercoris]|nr:hypothetical protein [Candidatus Pygmaiobacter gallistercoris]